MSAPACPDCGADLRSFESHARHCPSRRAASDAAIFRAEAPMKRDMDLIRSILFEMERAPGGHAPDDFQVDGYDEETTYFHCYLMKDGGLIEATVVTEFQGRSPAAIPSSITWKGYEFLDAARESSTWNRGKELAAKAGNTSFTLLLETLTKLALGQLGPTP
jgi:hypothetical protein